MSSWDRRIHPCLLRVRGQPRNGAGRLGNRLTPPIGRRRFTHHALEQAPERHRIAVTHFVGYLLNGPAIGFEQLLCFFDTNPLHVVQWGMAGGRVETAAESAPRQAALADHFDDRVRITLVIGKPFLKR